MSGNSVFSNPGQIFGGDNSLFNNPNQVWGGENSVFRKPLGSQPQMPDVPTPPAPPDAGATRQGQINAQLQDERQGQSQRTLFTGGSGLLDQPTTASRVLLGS